MPFPLFSLRRYTQEECLAYLGARFHIMLDLPANCSDVDAGRELLKRFIMVHLTDNNDKYECLIEMIHKLYLFAKGDIRADNSDSLMNQAWASLPRSFLGNPLAWSPYVHLLEGEALGAPLERQGIDVQGPPLPEDRRHH